MRAWERSEPGELPVKTSDSDPIRVDFLPPDLLGGTGRLGMTMAPGRRDEGSTAFWDRNLKTDLKRLRKSYGVDLLVCLIEGWEFRHIGAPDLLERARTHGMETLWHPIVDGGVPENRGEFRLVVQKALAAIRGGKTVVAHCRAGLGRTGTFAACVLVEGGIAPGKAILAVRLARPGTIENSDQEAVVRRHGR